MKRILLIFIFYASFSFANMTVDKKHILVIHSYHKTMSWVTDIDRAIQDTLKPHENNYVLYTEYLDTKRIFNQKYLKDLQKIYKFKYKNIKFDLILASDNNAFDFLKKYRDDTFGNIPVSFSGLNNFKQNDLEGTINFTGLIEDIDAKRTIEIALQLYPQTKNIFVIHDYLKTGILTANTIKEQLKGIDKNITYSKNTSLEKIQEIVQNLDEETIVLLGSFFKDSEGKYFTYEKIGEKISSSSKVPVFGLYEFYMNKGIAGGSVIGGYSQGVAQSQIGIKILEGIPVHKIPVQLEGTNKLILDYNILQKYNTNFSAIPEDAMVLNQPVSFFKQHQSVIIVSSIVIFGLLFVILILLINIKKRKRIEKLLKDSESKITKVNLLLEEKVKQRTKDLEKQKQGFESLFENSPDGLLILKENKFVQCNQKAIEMLGYKIKEKLLNIHPAEVSPEFQADGRNSREKADEMIQLSIDKKGHQFEWIHTKSDGENSWIEVSLTPMILDSEDVIYVSWKDISDKKRNEEIILQQTKMAALGEMIANIAHQWRQPLNIITIGASEIKIEKEMGELEDEFLLKTCDTINNNAQYLSKTIDDFKDFIIGDRDKIQFKLDQTIERFIHLVEGTIKKNQINVVQNLDNTISLESYPNELIQCLINIFNNSKDALMNKEEDRYFFIDTQIENNIVLITCKDNAGGIPKEVLPNIFEPYFTTKHKSQGTGLGLSMTYNLISEGMKGTIEAKNITFKYQDKEFFGAELIIKLPKNI